MENIKINVAELLKDCPKGMELYSPLCGKCVFDRISMGTIICKKQNNQDIAFTSRGYYMLPIFDGCECVIFPSKEQRDWSKFQRPFKDGDILTIENYFPFIYKTCDTDGIVQSYCGINTKGVFYKTSDRWTTLDEVTFATEEEKERLFQAIKANGYKWNSETKTLEKLIEPNFKDGDIVATDTGHWIGITEGGIKDSFIPTYCVLKSNGQFEAYFDEKRKWCFYRLATEEEKAKLFQVIKDNGYKWNSETKTLEKLFEPKFKDGDIAITNLNSIVIVSNNINNDFYETHCGLFGYNSFVISNVYAYVDRLATEEEKQKLFDAINANGYKWNEENKTLEKIEPKFKVGDKIKKKDNTHLITIKDVKDGYYIIKIKYCNITDKLSFNNQDDYELVPNKFDFSTLIPFESKVLVRNSDRDYWLPDVYVGRNKFDNFVVLYKIDPFYKKCIPYEGNEDLLGTTNDCDNFYKL